MNALLLAGHGSHLSAQTAGLVWSYVDRLRAQGVADEIGACFWKERPAYRQSLDTICADRVVVVPVLAADGYFARSVIPAEMGLDGPVTRRGDRRIYYTRPLGMHPRLGKVLQQRVEKTMSRTGVAIEEVAVAVIGHGTRRDANSRESARRQAQTLGEAMPGLRVIEAYLDDEPSIASIYERTDAPVLLAAPWFLAPGSHVSVDVPRELGLAPGAACGNIRGRAVHYLDAAGTADSVCELILELARDCVPELGTTRPGSVWSGFPQAGAQLLRDEVCELGQLVFGELLLTPTEVRPVSGTGVGRCVTSPAALRSIVRERPFRPLPELRDLPTGWRVAISQPEMLAAVVETVYPGVVADWATGRSGAFRQESLETVAARQTGMFRGIDKVPAETLARVTAALCDNCVRQPARDEGASARDTLPCGSPCNLWLSQATMEQA